MSMRCAPVFLAAALVYTGAQDEPDKTGAAVAKVEAAADPAS